MKKKEKLSEEYAPKGNAFTDISRPAFVAGFEKARELIAAELLEQSEWVYEGFNSGDMTIRECQVEERTLKFSAKRAKRIGDEEVQNDKAS